MKMPTTNIRAIKRDSLNSSIKYIVNDEKTNNGVYISSRYGEKDHIESFKEELQNDIKTYNLSSKKKEYRHAKINDQPCQRANS